MRRKERNYNHVVPLRRRGIGAEAFADKFMDDAGIYFY